MTTKLAWPQIEPQLRQLRLSADDLKDRFPEEGDFMPRFADLADEILEAANDACIEDASVRITDMLIELGYVPDEHRQH
ncbi:hypothetical protein [Lysobacter panacisoli]|uniref:MafI family immunity protein n=1 Tax=Lysobacter panacisoli TaxID=1255263 RepID=A0ABP9LD68_9GAMM|nr:hypothetical protein [Lysobacter panacisoli]